MMRWMAVRAPFAAVTTLQDYFMHKGQVCLVMDRLHNSLVDVIVKASGWSPDALINQVRNISVHLLVST